MALSKIQSESMNLADTYAFTGTVSGVQDFVHLSTFAVASGAGTVDIATDSSTYSHFKLFMSDVSPATDSTNLLHRVSTDSGSTYISASGSYGYNNFGRRASGTFDNEDSNSDTRIKLNVSEAVIGNHNNDALSGELTFIGFDQDRPKIISHTTNRNSVNNYAYSYVNGVYFLDGGSTPITNIRFYWASGNFLQGTFKLFGIKS